MIRCTLIILQGSGGGASTSNVIVISQLGNSFRLGIFEDEYGDGILTTTKI